MRTLERRGDAVSGRVLNHAGPHGPPVARLAEEDFRPELTERGLRGGIVMQNSVTVTVSIHCSFYY